MKLQETREMQKCCSGAGKRDGIPSRGRKGSKMAGDYRTHRGDFCHCKGSGEEHAREAEPLWEAISSTGQLQSRPAKGQAELAPGSPGEAGTQRESMEPNRVG